MHNPDSKINKLFVWIFLTILLVTFLIFINAILYNTASHLYFLIHELGFKQEELHVYGIFTEVIYPDYIEFNKNFFIYIPEIFGNKYQTKLYLDPASWHILMEINNDFFRIKLNRDFFLFLLFIFSQIPIFYFILKKQVQKSFKEAKVIYFIKSKMGEDYLADKITQTIASNLQHELKTPLTAMEALTLKNRNLVNFILDALDSSCSACPIRQESNLKLAKKYAININKNKKDTCHDFRSTVDQNFKLMEDAIMNMFNTVNMIKNLDVLDTDKTITIAEIIEASVNIFKLSSNYNFNIIIDDDLKKCYLEKLDPHALSNIIINHVKNSLEAKAQIIKFEKYNTYTEKHQNFIDIDIIDDGEGIPKEILKKAYQLNLTSKESGTGVGLYICKAILNRYGGDEKIKYTDKFGTIFRLKLPIKKCIKEKE